MASGLPTGIATGRRSIVTVTTRYPVDFTNAPSGEGRMTRDRSTEAPCAAKVARTVWKTSGRGDPLAELNRAIRPGVWWRTGSLGTQSAAGSRFVEARMTVGATLQQQHRKVLTSMTDACQAVSTGEPAPSLLPCHSEAEEDLPVAA